ncbi:MAG: 30S ribosomal protein S9 [Anaerolineae bacterium]|nr:30S ribosomal protein S9 [Anaerolineae bacterium]
MAESQVAYYEGLGRRKEATARVRLYPEGEGSFVANDKPLAEYFSRAVDRMNAVQPLQVTGAEGSFNVSVKVNGGGVNGQAEAVRLGVARALLKADPDYRQILREHGMLTRDARAKERKKPGLKRARKAPQYTKR